MSLKIVSKLSTIVCLSKKDKSDIWHKTEGKVEPITLNEGESWKLKYFELLRMFALIFIRHFHWCSNHPITKKLNDRILGIHTLRKYPSHITGAQLNSHLIDFFCMRFNVTGKLCSPPRPRAYERPISPRKLWLEIIEKTHLALRSSNTQRWHPPNQGWSIA